MFKKKNKNGQARLPSLRPPGTPSAKPWRTGSGVSGQAMIIIVMVMAISTLLLTQVVLMNMTSLTLAEESTEGDVLFTRAEGYLENAAIRYVRNVNYTGETLNDGDISCTIVVTPLGGGTTDLVSSCSRNGRTKNAGMQAALAAGRFAFSKITER